MKGCGYVEGQLAKYIKAQRAQAGSGILDPIKALIQKFRIPSGLQEGLRNAIQDFSSKTLDVKNLKQYGMRLAQTIIAALASRSGADPQPPPIPPYYPDASAPSDVYDN
jgi:hypothetical protein